LICTRLFGMLLGRAKSLESGDLRIESLNLRVPNLTALTRQFLEQIKSPESTSEINLQTVKNLIFLGRHFYETSCPLPRSKVVKNGDERDIKICLSWLISRVAAEIRYERIVSEVHRLLSIEANYPARWSFKEIVCSVDGCDDQSHEP
jgi:hypothetical protein